MGRVFSRLIGWLVSLAAVNKISKISNCGRMVMKILVGRRPWDKEQ